MEVKEDMEVSKSKMFKVVHVEDNGGMDTLEFYDFPPGCIVAVSVCLNDIQSEALSRVRGTLLHQVCQFCLTYTGSIGLISYHSFLKTELYFYFF